MSFSGLVWVFSLCKACIISLCPLKYEFTLCSNFELCWHILLFSLRAWTIDTFNFQPSTAGDLRYIKRWNVPLEVLQCTLKLPLSDQVYFQKWGYYTASQKYLAILLIVLTKWYVLISMFVFIKKWELVFKNRLTTADIFIFLRNPLCLSEEEQTGLCPLLQN